MNIVINWETAVVINQQEVDKRKLNKEESLQEFLDSDFSILDATDINHYAAITGISPNELRRMHPDTNLQDMVNSFLNDDSDAIFEFF